MVGGNIINPIISCLFHSMGTAMSGEICHLNVRIFYASVQELNGPYIIFPLPVDNQSYLTPFDIIFQPVFPISFIY